MGTSRRIIITAARVIGEKSPLLIDAKSLAFLPDNTVIVDLSAGEGGSVMGSKQDSVIHIERGISIINISGYPKAQPKEASEAFAACMTNLLFEIIENKTDIDFEHHLIHQFIRS